ncbi:hypothetical protein SAMN05660686_02495 [Thalassobaculum litoreum DSM 18839]|uniref:Uncharacterized protein n=1 Tax=Thalassobaculum litoreum DSM 18839 TaxID=1123362 RepID=A0A8G2F3C1_9PROT|nr:hypothetical protein SAMN05660686_02495 [Thalassobaculum litoreum DSM 18839]
MTQHTESAPRLSRRFVTVGLAAATWVACRAVEEVVFDTAKDLVTPERVAEPFVGNDIMALFTKYASRSQMEAFRRWDAGEDVVDSLGEICEDRRYAVIDFSNSTAVYSRVGERLSVLNPGTVGAPVVDAPTPEYGRFVYSRALAVRMSGRPSFMSCAGRLPGRSGLVSYAALMLPSGAHVVSIGQPSAPAAGDRVTARRDGRALDPAGQGLAI